MTSFSALFLGIDGGGTSCRARLADATGTVLGEGTGGPANITTDLGRAAVSITEATGAALAAAGLEENALSRIHAGFGMAGGNSPAEAEALARWPFGFAAQRVASDAEIACLGSHGSADGAILILGTGSQGVARIGGETRRVGGWGFALSDTGSGALLGRAAARRSLLAHEGILSASAFTERVMARFAFDPPTMLTWALKAIPRDFGEFAPLVFEHALSGDPVAGELLAEAVRDVSQLLDRLIALGAQRIALMGGLARPYRPHLPARFDAVLVEPAGDALDGALVLAGLEMRR